jgi:hypothetical protein
MKTQLHPRFEILFVVALALLTTALSPSLSAQSNARIDFTARVAPTDGRPEPVRQLTFYLLRKSLADIRTDVAKQDPAPDLDEFVDSTAWSPEMKAWMKKHHTVQLSGGDFTKLLKPDDIVNVPELFTAFMSRNAGFEGAGFPKPKYKPKDITADPEKYKLQKEEYKTAIKKFITTEPTSILGIDADLTEPNPYEKWSKMLGDRDRRMEKATLNLAQRNYVVAQADTDLDGRGSFSNLPPGDYWIGTLGTQAIAGDVRLRWDYPITIRAGEAAHIDLTNLNAAEPVAKTSDSTP